MNGLLTNLDENRPSPFTNADRKRWERISRARRFLEGMWEKDVQKELDERLSADRRAAWGKPVLSVNLFRDLHVQVGGVLYDQTPRVSHELEVGTLLGAGGLVERSGLWPLMQSFAEELSGLSDHAIRIHFDEENGVTLAPVYSDYVVALAPPSRPSVPHTWAELQARINPSTGNLEWVWEILSIQDVNSPVHRIVLHNDDALKPIGYTDRTELYTRPAEGSGKASLSGADYMFRDSLGKAFLPVSLYHVRPNRLWNDHLQNGLIAAALDVAVLWSFWKHVVEDASWPQRATAGMEPRGARALDAGKDGRVQSLSADPANIMLFDLVDNESEVKAQPMQWQWEAGADPETLERAISRFVSRLSAHFGVPASDILRTASGDAQSGYAISLSNAGLRRIQRRMEPQLRSGDLRTLELLAKVSNRGAGTHLPESGYAITYPALPKSPEEVKAETEDIAAKMDRGLLSRIDGLLQLHPGITREQAIATAKRIDQDNAAFGTGRAATP